jgi:excisionase family DNA binding protein
MTDNPIPRLALSVPDAAVALGLAESTVWEMIKNGEIQSFQHKRRRLISIRAIEAWIAAKENGPNVSIGVRSYHKPGRRTG